MTIRKITGRTSSLATRATVTQNGIFKASVTNQSGLKKLQNLSSVLVPKATSTLSKIIDHLLYDPDGFGYRFFRDYTTPLERFNFLITKTNRDTISVDESIFVGFVRNRLPSDTLNTADQVNRLLRTFRTFDDSVGMLSNLAIGDGSTFYEGKNLYDSYTVADFFNISRVKLVEDTLSSNDTFARLIKVQRTFDDSVGMLSNMFVGDGSTFLEGKLFRDVVTIGSQGTGFRTSGDPLESTAFLFDKYLDPDAEMLDQFKLLGLKGISEDLSSIDRPQLLNLKPIVEDANIASDSALIVPNKGFNDSVTLLQNIVSYFIDKAFYDETMMLDATTVGDRLVYESDKYLFETLIGSDKFSPTLTKPFLETVSITDTPIKNIGLNRYETLNTAELFKLYNTLQKTENILSDDIFRKVVGKNYYEELNSTDVYTKRIAKNLSEGLVSSDDFSRLFVVNRFADNIANILESFLIVPNKGYLDTVSVTDTKQIFNIYKGLSDNTLMEDFFQFGDGQKWAFSKDLPLEDQPVTDYFARSVLYVRYPFDFFLDNTVYPDTVSKFDLLDAKSGTLTNVPILRTNRIAWSEEFQQPYWTSTGLRITTNTTNPPANVITPSSPTYDADQLQTLFYNKPGDPYLKAWYQLAPTRFKISSNGDLIVATSSNTAHYVSTPNIDELKEGTNFVFSTFVKYAGNRNIQLWAANNIYGNFDISSGTVLNKTATYASIKPVGSDGWWLCQIGAPVITFGTAPQLQQLGEILLDGFNNNFGTNQYALFPEGISKAAVIFLLDNNQNLTYAGDGTSGAIIWGAQLETGNQVEAEQTALNYIRTAGGPASRIGFRVTPQDRDRVYVGTMLRDGTTTRVSGDQYENLSYLVSKTANPDTFNSTDYFARSTFIKLAGHLNDASGLTNIVTAGLPGQRRYSGDSQEQVAFWFNKSAKKGTTSTSTAYAVTRNNYIRFSERFDHPYWVKSNVRAASGVSTIAGALPYRNVTLDADQVHHLTWNSKNNYTLKKWYNIVPLKTRSNFTSNAIVDIFEGADNNVHNVQTFGFATSLESNYFASSVYASNANGVNRFRMQVGTVYADFDLSSVSVITSVGTLYQQITTIDAASKWYLCQIIGPATAIGTLNHLETITLTEGFQLLRPYNVSPDFITPSDARVIFTNKAFADTTLMLDTMQLLGDLTYQEIKALFDSFNIGTTNTGVRNSGDTLENVSFIDKFNAHRGGDFTSLTIKLANNPILQADATVDVFANKTNKTWFQLAPYYKSSAHLNDYPTDYDSVRIGSQTGGRRQSNNPFETLNIFLDKPTLGRDTVSSTDVKTRAFYDKHVDETKLIPTYPKYDAQHVHGLFYNTPSYIDGKRYTPQDGNYAYYKRNEWYNLVPRYGRPRFAYGTGNTPGTIMIDNMQLGDDFTYAGQITLNSADNFVLPGTQNGGFRYSNDTSETLAVFVNKDAKQSTFTDLYIAKQRPTKFNGDQVYQLFYNTSNNVNAYIKNNPYKKAWYQLAPYYNSYDHIKASPNDRDTVFIGSRKGGKRELGWPFEIISLGTFKIPSEIITSTETKRTNYVNITSKRSTPNTSYVVLTQRTNYLSYSESFNNSYWIKNNVSVSVPVQVMSGALPYRNVKLDADQVTQIFYATSNNVTANNYYNNYYQRQWYSLAPTRTRKAFVSNILNVMNDGTSTTTSHSLQTTVNLLALDAADRYFSVSTYVSSGTSNFRLAVQNVENVYCDFNLSSGSVITSVGTIYNRITRVDTSLGVYLCQMVGPIVSVINNI